MEQLEQEIKDKKKQIFDYVVSTGRQEQLLFQGNDAWYLQLKEELKQLREERLILLRQQQQPQQGNLINSQGF